ARLQCGRVVARQDELHLLTDGAAAEREARARNAHQLATNRGLDLDLRVALPALPKSQCECALSCLAHLIQPVTGALRITDRGKYTLDARQIGESAPRRLRHSQSVLQRASRRKLHVHSAVATIRCGYQTGRNQRY